MGNLIIVSNRLPVSVVKKGGELVFRESVGGVATGLNALRRRVKNVLWIGWPGIVKENIRGKESYVTEKLRSLGLYPVFLSKKDKNAFYYGFCNKTIWPLFHYFTQYVILNKNYWRAYERVNKMYLEAVLEVYSPGDIIWVHDYHLMLLPKLIREALPEATIGFFLHIPFPSFEVFRMLPWRKEILEGLLGADLIGFHTYDYACHFLDSVSKLLGYEHSLGYIYLKDRVVKVDAFPMGIDFEYFNSAVKNPKVKAEIKRLKKRVKGKKLVFSIDRLDYTKGVVLRLKAYDEFLNENPEFREKVILVLVVVPSRTGIKQYMEFKKEVEKLVGEINGKYGTFSWTPIWYLYRYIPQETLIALYYLADVALITPVRDGMNLVAKEYIATKVDGRGVLILSEFAGASRELVEALIVNPFNTDEVAKALKEALTMPLDEQVLRNKVMRDRLRRYDVHRWANAFLNMLMEVKEVQEKLYVRRLSEEQVREIIGKYRRSGKRLLFLDYDGTLVPFHERPEKAVPDPGLLKLLKQLASDPKNEVVIISGRDRETLDRWFSGLGASLVAEHGAFIKERGSDWRVIEPLRNDWKKSIRPILELYVDRTPGTFIEEKEFSLVWNYRKAYLEEALMRVRELKDVLRSLTANLGLEIKEGSRSLEIKNVGVNKGKAALHWLSKGDWGFILAAGDDWTDEDLFEVLPKDAYSIKVGLTPSKAMFYVNSYVEVRKLLSKLVSTT